MHLVVVGLSHKTAPIELRERVAFGKDELRVALPQLHLHECVSECAILSTCNRTEIYAVVSTVDCGSAACIEFLAHSRDIKSDELTKHLYTLVDEACARHLLRVAAGLESMMLGETQILGQVRDAHRVASECNTLRAALHELFQTAIRAGKRARAETGISEGALSVGGAAVELAKRIHGNLHRCNVLLIGAGEIGRVTAKAIVRTGVRKLWVANRTFERAVKLAMQLGGEAIPYNRMFEWLPQADIVITSTGSSVPIISRDDILNAMRARRHRPLFIVDIAIPRDVDPTVGEIDSAFLFNIDDLQAVVDQNIAQRQQHIAAVEKIVHQELECFMRWWHAQQAKPLMLALLNMVQEICDDELRKALNDLPQASEREQRVMRMLAKNVAMRILKQPLEYLKSAMSEDSAQRAIDAVRAAFQLDAIGKRNASQSSGEDQSRG